MIYSIVKEVKRMKFLALNPKTVANPNGCQLKVKFCPALLTGEYY